MILVDDFGFKNMFLVVRYVTMSPDLWMLGCLECFNSDGQKLTLIEWW
jgi:hypothetical protein